MAKPLCQYCEEPMPWWYKVLFYRTCSNCVFRMSRGVGPRRRARGEADRG